MDGAQPAGRQAGTLTVGKGDYASIHLRSTTNADSVLIDLIRMWKPEFAEKYLSIKKDGDDPAFEMVLCR